MQNKFGSRRVWALMALVVWIGGAWGCSPQNEQMAWKPTARVETQPTSTPRPTATRQFTATLEPASTYTVTPTVTATYPASVRQRPFRITVNAPLGGGTQPVTLRGLLYLPTGYDSDPTRRWPLILYLHGSGEAGSDLYLLKKQMLPKYLETRDDFPFIVVSPQIPAPSPQSLTIPLEPEQYMETYGWNPWIDRLDLLLDAVQADYRVDASRVYLTGISLGGFGTWNYALRYPNRFAAIVPIAGGYQFYARTIPKQLCDLKDLPIWAFHGGQDNTVPVWQSEILIDALTNCGGSPRLTIYPEAGHDAWSQAYLDPELLEWLLAQTK